MVQVSESQTFIVLNALEGEDLPLANVLKLDFSKAVGMAGGVRVFHRMGSLSSHIFFLCQILNPNPICTSVDILAGGHQKVI